MDALFGGAPALTLEEAAEGKLRNGAAAPLEGADGEYRVYSSGGEFLAFAELRGGSLRAIKSFFEV